jgi:hypothetical protein
LSSQANSTKHGNVISKVLGFNSTGAQWLKTTPYEVEIIDLTFLLSSLPLSASHSLIKRKQKKGPTQVFSIKAIFSPYLF